MRHDSPCDTILGPEFLAMPHVLLGRGGAAPCTGCEAPCGVNSRGCVAKFRVPYDKRITRVHYSHCQYPYSHCQYQLFAAPVRLLGILIPEWHGYSNITRASCVDHASRCPARLSSAVAHRTQPTAALGLHQILVLRHVLPRAVEAAGRNRHESCQSRVRSSPWATLRRETSVSSRSNRSCAVVCA